MLHVLASARFCLTLLLYVLPSVHWVETLSSPVAHHLYRSLGFISSNATKEEEGGRKEKKGKKEGNKCLDFILKPFFFSQWNYSELTVSQPLPPEVINPCPERVFALSVIYFRDSTQALVYVIQGPLTNGLYPLGFFSFFHCLRQSLTKLPRLVLNILCSPGGFWSYDLPG